MTYSIRPEDQARLDNLFSYHAPFGDQAQRYETIRASGGAFAEVLMEMCPPSAERTLAIRDIEMAVMRANQSIAVNEIETVQGGTIAVGN